MSNLYVTRDSKNQGGTIRIWTSQPRYVGSEWFQSHGFLCRITQTDRRWFPINLKLLPYGCIRAISLRLSPKYVKGIRTNRQTNKFTMGRICQRDENKRLSVIIEEIRQALGMQIDDDDILGEIKYLQEVTTTPPNEPVGETEMTVKEIITEYLKEHGFDGLRVDHCTCELADLMPCVGLGLEEDISVCEPGYKVACDRQEGCNKG